MTKAREVKQPKHEVDSIWDGWLDSLKTMQNYQQEVADKSMLAFQNQKEIIRSAKDALTKLEEQSAKVSADWKTSVQKTMEQSKSNHLSPTASTWMNQLNEVSSTIQAISWTPSKMIVDLFSQSQIQLEENMKNVLDQQRKGSAEALQTIESAAVQMKETHKKLLSATV